MSIEFKDNRGNVLSRMDDLINNFLKESSGEIIAETKKKSRVDTGKTKGSFTYKIDTKNHIAQMGSNEENAIWEEFGTGEYAIKGNGRKGGWSYQDEDGNWHYTKGKRPSRAFYKAYVAKKKVVKQRAEQVLGGLNK